MVSCAIANAIKVYRVIINDVLYRCTVICKLYYINPMQGQIKYTYSNGYIFIYCHKYYLKLGVLTKKIFVLHVHARACTHVCVCVCEHRCVHMCTFLCDVCMSVCMHVCVCMHACVHVQCCESKHNLSI